MKKLNTVTIILLVLMLLLPVMAGACKTTEPTTPTTPSTPTTPATPAEPAAEPVELKFAHMFPPPSPEGHVSDKWAEKIGQDSNGLLTVRVYGGSTLVTAPEMIIGTKDGVTDIGYAFVYKPEGREISASLPFIMSASTTKTATQVLDDLWKEFPDLYQSEWGREVKVLWMTSASPQTLFTRTQKIGSAADVKGLQIRVPSQELGAFIEKLGGTPVYMSTADLAVALEKKTVDGCINMYSAGQAYKLTMLKHSVKLQTFALGEPTPVFVVMNWDAWNNLQPDQQKVITDSLEWGKQLSVDTWTGLEQAGLEYFESIDGEYDTLSAEEEAKWQSYYNEVKADAMAKLDAQGLPGTEVLNFINERVAAYEK